MRDDRVAARDVLLARTSRIGMALTVLTAGVTGAVAGLLARPAPEPATSTQPVAVPPPPVVLPAPRPRRTVYVQIPAVLPQVERRTAQQPRAQRPAAVRQRSAPRPPPAPPQRTQSAPVTSSSGS